MYMTWKYSNTLHVWWLPRKLKKQCIGWLRVGGKDLVILNFSLNASGPFLSPKLHRQLWLLNQYTTEQKLGETWFCFIKLFSLLHLMLGFKESIYCWGLWLPTFNILPFCGDCKMSCLIWWSLIVVIHVSSSVGLVVLTMLLWLSNWFTFY